MPTTFYFAALLALFYMYLTLNVIKLRRSERVAIGAGDSKLLARAIRVHANFAEYVPFTLILLYFLESQQAHSIIIWLLGSLLLVARIVHAYGVKEVKEQLKFRVFGMFTNISIIIFTACYLLLIGIN